MRKSNYPPVGLPLSGVSPFSQSLCPYLSPLALSPQVLTVLIVAKGRLWICCKILCPSFICHQTFCTKKRLGRNYSWIAETNTDKSETGGEAERKQKKGILVEGKKEKMKGWGMAEKGKGLLGCFIDTLLLASRIINHSDRSPNSIYIHTYGQKHISTHTSSLPLSLWAFGFGKSTSHTTFQSSRP